MMNAAIFFPLYSTILHWLAAGSEDIKGGGERDLKLKHNYSPQPVMAALFTSKLDPQSH